MTVANDILTLIRANSRLGPLIAASDKRGDHGAFVGLRKVAGADFKPLLEALVAPHDWYVSRQDDRNPGIVQLFVEARVHPSVTPPETLYHASLATNRASIEVDGLKLHALGSTWMKRVYDPPRVHFAVTRAEALTFIASATAGTSATQGLTQVGGARLTEWDLWIVRPGDEPYYDDVEMNTAVWTTVAIPANRLTRIDPDDAETEPS